MEMIQSKSKQTQILTSWVDFIGNSNSYQCTVLMLDKLSISSFLKQIVHPNGYCIKGMLVVKLHTGIKSFYGSNISTTFISITSISYYRLQMSMMGIYQWIKESESKIQMAILIWTTLAFSQFLHIYRQKWHTGLFWTEKKITTSVKIWKYHDILAQENHTDNGIMKHLIVSQVLSALQCS